jgi:hypothetical protein
VDTLTLTIALPGDVTINALREQLDTFEAMLPSGRNGTIRIRGKKLVLSSVSTDPKEAS